MKTRERELLAVIEGWRSPPEDPEGLAKSIDRECALVEWLSDYPDPTAAEWASSIDKFSKAVLRASDALPLPARTMLRQHMALNDPRFMACPPVEDMLDALLDAAIDLREDSPPAYARYRPDLAKVYGAAKACVSHGVKVSASERSRFLSIIKVLVPERADLRDLVRQAKEGDNFPKNS